MKKTLSLFVLILVSVCGIRHASLAQGTAPQGDNWYKMNTKKSGLYFIKAHGDYAINTLLVQINNENYNSIQVQILSEYSYHHKLVKVEWGWLGSGDNTYLAFKCTPVTADYASHLIIESVSNPAMPIDLEPISAALVTPFEPKSLSVIAGSIGLGTTNPSGKLDVRGVISTPEIAFRNDDGGDDSDPYRLRKVKGASNNNWLELQLNDDPEESFRIYGNSCVGNNCGPYSNNLYHSFDALGNAYHKGNVGIGTTDTKGFKFAVAGPMIAESVKVQLQNSWSYPDYVFKPSYKLPALSEVEAYIKANQHLPEIPSEKEAKANGVDLGEMNAKLLKKIEELTLYLIEMEKRSETLKESINSQGALIEQQRLRIIKLEDQR